MPKVTSALGFAGQAGRAIELYKKALNARVITKLHYSDADPKDFVCTNEAQKDYVYYGEMVIGNQLISFGDNPEGFFDNEVSKKASAVSLLVEFDTLEELNAAYELMAEGATILTPMTSTTYCTGYVVLVDMFGIHWSLMSGYAG